MRDNAQAQRASNLLKLTEEHRDIWKMAMSNPKLARVLEPKLDLVKHPVTTDEARFVGFLFLHLNASFQALKVGVLIKAEGLGADIREFLTLPIPQAVWQKNRQFYDAEFVKYVESQ